MRTRQAHNRESRQNERGLALIGVIGLLLVFLVFVGAMMAQLIMEGNSVRISAASNRALNAADAGVHAMAEQIQTSVASGSALPGTFTYVYPEPGASPSTTQYTATLEQVTSAGGLDYYQILSVGTYNSGFEHVTRQVRAIAKDIPLSDFASFSIYEVNKYGNPVWYLRTQHFDGPVYSGGPMRIAYATPAPSPLPTIDPIFGSSVQTGNNPVWSPGDPNLTGDWSSVISGGAKAFEVDPSGLGLPQPAETKYVASEAWEGDSTDPFVGGFPAVNPGVYIDGSTSGGHDAATSTQPVASTGIYINVAGGNATITSKVLGNTDTMTINGPGFGGAYTVTINYGDFSTAGDCSGSTTVTHGSSSHTFSGTPCGQPGPGVTNTGNGAIFANGGMVFGTGAQPDTVTEGTYAFVTPDYSSWTQNNTIQINGNFTYDLTSSGFDKTMLWANDVVLKTKVTTGIGIDASIIAGYPGETWRDGNFSNFYCGPTSCGNSDQHNLTIFGSLVENERGAVGEVIGGNQFGFSRIINFDQRFATSPPPWAPTTGALQIIAWADLGT